MMPCLSCFRPGLCLLWCLVPASQAAEKPVARPGYTGQGLVVHTQTRTPDQMAAFYTGRGFPAGMLAPIARACFVTLGMRHGRQDVVWLEPSRWQMRDAAGNAVQRLDRDYWDRVWASMQAPPASRATFGWTQLPERRDLRPGEPVGGNITVLPPKGPFSIELRFATGQGKKGPEIRARIEGLQCEAPPAVDGAGEGGP